jgi:hypothetical protein
MSRSRNQQSHTAAMLLEIVQVLKEEPCYEVAGRRIDEITRRYLTMAAEQERHCLQRSAARMAFSAATDKGASFETITRRFRARCALGFDDVFSELAVVVEFADVCADHAQCATGLRVLEDARGRLASSGLLPNHKGARELSKLIESCRQRLANGE